VFALAYFVVDFAELPQWHVNSVNSRPAYSAAGYWHLLFSLPLLVIQLFGWVWRHLLWCRLLRFTAHLPLRLIAAHPDRCGGLRLVGGVPRGYWPLCFALGVIVGGRAANQIEAGLSLYDCRMTILGLLILVLAFVLTPLVFFVPVLVKLSAHATVTYSGLAHALGQQFEAKWIRDSVCVNPSTLEAPDFSATTDLYSIVTNAQQIQLFPARFATVYELVVVTLLPFIPVALISVPLDTILSRLGKFLI
jgi:hypothetical protein